MGSTNQEKNGDGEIEIDWEELLCQEPRLTIHTDKKALSKWQR